ncbi:hypothetical protein [Spirosoma utsteinense]|uniref:hypothetical protein n=1 Tax=Spirosoma utsteinense TaxID=2585773 RepID=UPI001644CAD1|nr:hypothetical protein [Spirosoma utsteinense]MBC3789112.1 hypothetical protein [Spirosoma utsteinense]
MNLYKSYQRVIKADSLFGRSEKNVNLNGQEASNFIKERILEGSPLMISRFGANEINILLNYYLVKDNMIGNLVVT